MVHKILLPLKAAIAWALSYTLVISLICIWLPFYVYKQLLTIIVPICLKEVSGALPSSGAILFDDYSNSAETSCSISAIVEISETQTTLPELIEIFEKNVLNQKLNQEGKKRYLELTQFPISVLGHPFWKTDTKFSVSNHIWENKDKSTHSTASIHNELLNLKYPKNMSPWQLIMYRNKTPKKIFLALRFHHCICDGRSVLKLIVEGLGQKPLLANEAKFCQQSIFDKIMFYISFPTKILQSAFYLLELQLKVGQQPFNEHHYNQPGHPVPIGVGVTKKFYLKDLKCVANKYGIRTSAILLSALTMAVKKLTSLDSTRYKYFSTNLQIYVALPLENHPPTLLNHLLFCLAELKPCENYVEQLYNCDATYHHLRESDDARYFMVLSSAVASLPKALRSFIARNQGVTMGISNISGEKNEFLVGESRVTDLSMCSSPPMGTIGVSFLTMSYKECIQVCIVAKGNILSKHEIDMLTSIMEVELNNLLTNV